MDQKGEITKEYYGCGAFYADYNDVSISWANEFTYPLDIEDNIIPCVLGASYVGSKQQWEYLDGLEGLKYYGLDEQLISIKTWMNGHKCRVIHDVKFGHIFRTSDFRMPYEARKKEFFINIFFIAELFYSQEMKINMFRHLRTKLDETLFTEVLADFSQEKRDTIKFRQRYKKLFPKDINYFIDVNQQFINQLRKPSKRKKIK